MERGVEGRDESGSEMREERRGEMKIVGDERNREERCMNGRTGGDWLLPCSPLALTESDAVGAVVLTVLLDYSSAGPANWSGWDGVRLFIKTAINTASPQRHGDKLLQHQPTPDLLRLCIVVQYRHTRHMHCT